MAKPKNTTSDVAENATPATNAVEGAEGNTTDATATPTEGKKAGGSAILMADGQRRVDYIRQEFAKGRKRGEIAKELGVAYQIVFAATKAPKADVATVDGAGDAPAEATSGDVETGASADAAYEEPAAA